MRTIVDRSGDVVAARLSRQRMTAELNDYFEEVVGLCPVHFGYHNSLRKCLDYNCDRHSDFAPWELYPNFKARFRFDPFTYCYSCGAPNDQPDNNFYQLPCHPFPVEMPCKWSHFVFRTIFVVWHRPDISPVLCEVTGAPPIGLEKFTAWATKDPSGTLAGEYFNGMRFFMAYCHMQTVEGGVFEHMIDMRAHAYYS